MDSMRATDNEHYFSTVQHQIVSIKCRKALFSQRMVFGMVFNLSDNGL